MTVGPSNRYPNDIIDAEAVNRGTGVIVAAVRAWRLIPLVVVALFAAAASAGGSPRTTLHVSVAGMPSTGSLGTPIRIRAKITDRGPSVIRGITVSVGVEKLTGAGARPGLILTGPIEARIGELAVGKSKTVTLKVIVPATSHGGYFGAGSYNIGPSINVRSPVNLRLTGVGSNVTKPNITLS